MCRDCGCGLPGKEGAAVSASHQEHEHAHEGHTHAHTQDPLDHHHHREHGADHEHGHSHEHGHDHPHTHDDQAASGPAVRRTVELRQAILGQNERLAERNRGFFRAKGVLVINVVSSPGSGKTTLLKETLKGCRGRLKSAVVVGDLATDNDAERLRETGAPVVQVTTGTVCHLDAEMVGKAAGKLDFDGLDLLIVENVGNLVCPASYDLGEDLRVVLLSVTEGEDKPLKYPPIFQGADVVVVSKIDIAEPCGYNRDTTLANIRRVAPNARIFELSAKTGQGMAPWIEYLATCQKQARGRSLFTS